MLSWLWNQCAKGRASRSYDETVEEFVKEKSHLQELRHLIDNWSRSDMTHQEFFERYCAWQFSFNGFGGKMMEVSQAGVLELMFQHSCLMREVFGIFQAIEKLKRQSYMLTATPKVKRSYLSAALASPLMPKDPKRNTLGPVNYA